MVYVTGLPMSGLDMSATRLRIAGFSEPGATAKQCGGSPLVVFIVKNYTFNNLGTSNGKCW